MYWCKANHIHAWFVDNVQNGYDDCRSYIIEPEKLKELLVVCEKVIEGSNLVDGLIIVSEAWNSKRNIWEAEREPGRVIEDPTVANDLLPTREGFFFGNYEYDEFYLDDVYETRDWVERILADRQSGVPGDIYYRSSW